MPPAELAATLEHRSGLLGLAGNADMRAVLEAEAPATRTRVLAVERLPPPPAGRRSPRWPPRSDGLDVLVFTGGVGERAAPIRARAAAGLAFLGVALDPEANAEPGLDADIGASAARRCGRS